jgi:hypothetical protein
VSRGRDLMRSQMYGAGPMNDTNLPDLSLDGPMTDQNLPRGIAPQPRRYTPPAYDYDAFDRMVAVGEPLQEGPNKNIDDETRMRALQWVMKQRS